MGDLSELALRTSYHKGRDDIAQAFYLPSMQRAIKYDRAVGYFRSTAFIIAWPALKGFVHRGAHIRVLCSHVLSDEDIEALDQGYSARADAALSAHFLEEIRSLLSDETMNAPARTLAALVTLGVLELKVAILRNSDARTAKSRIFHDKLGIFRDEHRNVVIFKGSMNETWAGLSSDGNLESVDVAASWMGARDMERVRSEQAYFDDLWEDRYPTLKVRPFPEVAKSELQRASPQNWETFLDEISHRQENKKDKRGRTLRPHQAAGLASWNANGRQGILAFATGSGKTFTAITAIREAIRERLDVVVVVVPDRVLFKQWYDELTETTKELGVRILRAGSGFQRWRDSLKSWSSPGEAPRLILATLRTAASNDFRQQLAAGSHLLLVADEVHRLGSPQNSTLLDEQLFGARLGLSATPERAGDPAGTGKLLSYFRGVLEPRYTLADAVRDGVLTKYFYRPHTVRLSEVESAEWKAISFQAAQTKARIESGDQSPGLKERLQRLFIQRARVVKHAEAKVPLAVDILTKEYLEGQRWIVYCDDLVQLNKVSDALLRTGIQNLPFHSQMEGDRTETLKWLDRRGGVIVAIKCLDEGVDIPSVTHALILASSKNPREFVQRRGRVLRIAPNKALAFVHDAIVLPEVTSGDSQLANDPIIAGELARAVEFAQNADNPASAADLQQIAVDAGMDWRRLMDSGIEDAED